MLQSVVLAGPSRHARAQLPRMLRPLAIRSLHVTRITRATEVPRDPMADPALQAFMEKVRNHQGAIDALIAVRNVLQSKGIDMSKPPSSFEMIRLGMDKELRQAAEKFREELGKAGVELNPQTMMEIFGKMRGASE